MAFDLGTPAQQYSAMGYPCYPGLPPPKAVLQQMGLPVSAPARSRQRGGPSYAHYPHYPPPSADAGPVADAAGHAPSWQQQQYYQPRHRGGGQQWQRHGQQQRQRHYQQSAYGQQRTDRQQDDGPYYKPTFIEDPWAPFLGKGKTLTHEDTWYKPSFVQDPWLNLLP